MPEPVLLAIVSAMLFVALMHMAVQTEYRPFRQATGIMALAGAIVTALAPMAGLAIVGPVLLARRLVERPYVPETVNELLDRYQ